MTATDELRRMLDERGVRWHGDIATYWRGADAVESLFADNALDVSLYAVSPERAIAATLWRGTCSVDGSTYWDEVAVWDYSLSCGCRFQWYDPEPPRYCPNCGRRVVAGDS